MAFYTSEHLKRIQLIKKMQQKKKLPLELIKKNLKKMKTTNKDGMYKPPAKFSRVRDTIIEVAINTFRKKGYADTTIDYIVSAAHVSKTTFYFLFKDKKTLFINCFEKIFIDTHKKTWGSVKSKKDFPKVLKKRLRAFYEEYPKWSDMMNMLGESL